MKFLSVISIVYEIKKVSINAKISGGYILENLSIEYDISEDLEILPFR